MVFLCGKTTVDLVLIECNGIFQNIEVLVMKSKSKTKEYSKGQLIERIKWDWEEKETINLRTA